MPEHQAANSGNHAAGSTNGQFQQFSEDLDRPSPSLQPEGVQELPGLPVAYVSRRRRPEPEPKRNPEPNHWHTEPVDNEPHTGPTAKQPTHPGLTGRQPPWSSQKQRPELLQHRQPSPTKPVEYKQRQHRPLQSTINHKPIECAEVPPVPAVGAWAEGCEGWGQEVKILKIIL